jgi:hypothetical protein
MAKSKRALKQSSRKRKNKNSKKRSSFKNTSMEIDLDFTDKSLIDFQKSKSISVATTKSDIKSSKIGELYSVKPIHDNIQRLCQLKIHGKSIKEDKEPVPKHIAKKLCECLFEKNQGLRIGDLENLVKNHIETPASSCISILDNYKSNKRSSKRSSKSSSKRSSKH